MKCSSCGAESQDNRFFCAACGAEMRDSSIAEGVQEPVNFRTRDIIEHGLVLVLMGAAIMVVGFLAYVVDLYANRGEEVVIGPTFRISETIPVIGLILLSVGIVINLGQRLKKVVTAAIAFEVISSVVSMVVAVVLMTTITKFEVVSAVEIKTYGYRSGAMLYFFTLGMIPVVMGFVLTVRSKYAWAAALAASAASMPASYLWLGNYFDSQTAVILSCVQLPVIITLLLPSLIRNYLRPASIPAVP